MRRVWVFLVCLVFLFSFVSASSSTTIKVDDKQYNVSLGAVFGDRVRLNINEKSTNSLNKQTSPYYLNYPIDGLYPVVKDIDYWAYAGAPNKVSLFLVYEVNLTEGCDENWTCSIWTSCLNNQQNRTCTDSNSCGSVDNKPSEIQSCNLDIECSSDDDCIIPSAGMPFCKRNSICIPYATFECINPGTPESFCQGTGGTEDCTPCPYECKNDMCISQPQKECTLIGSRQSGKYCSSEFKLIVQKANDWACENNFECKTNLCLENKCGNYPSNTKTIYWIMAGILAVVVIIAVLVIILRKK